jgi:hypothetical protein
MRGIRVVCATCHEYLGIARDGDGYSARWWADTMLTEHIDEYHDSESGGSES